MLNIQTQYLDHAVLQRDANGFCRSRILFADCSAGAEVSCFYTNIDGNCKKLAGKALADGDGQGELVLSSLPVGGPYDLIVECNSHSVKISDVSVGDVWLLAGQSNMVGSGKLSESLPPDPAVRCFGFHRRWEVASGRLHNIAEAREKAYDHIHELDAAIPAEKCNAAALGIGPGQMFGTSLHSLTGVPQGVIAGAIGASSLQDWHWEYKHSDRDVAYYGALLEKFKVSGGACCGLFWYQGEGEGCNQDRTEKYTLKTSRLLEEFRKDFADGAFYTILVQLSCHIQPRVDITWSSVREQQRKLQDSANNIAVIPTLDLELLDGIHLDSKSAYILGKRAADAAWALMNNDPAGLYPEPETIRAGWDPEIKAPTVEVTFRNVCGSLKHFTNRALGFYLHNPDGSVADTALCFTEVTGNKAVIHLTRWEYDTDPSEKYLVSFGAVCNPSITIFDEAGRVPLGFGPLPISK